MLNPFMWRSLGVILSREDLYNITVKCAEKAIGKKEDRFFLLASSKLYGLRELSSFDKG